MNKRYWLSLALDDSLQDEEVMNSSKEVGTNREKNKESYLTFSILPISKIFFTEEIFRK